MSDSLITGEKNTLSLSNNETNIDLSLLSPESQEEIRKRHALGRIKLQEKAQEMGLETLELNENLQNFQTTVVDATRNGTFAQITKTQNNSLGRTEVIIGNTDNAAKGKFTKSQTGERDNTVMYVVIGLVGLIIIFLILK